MSENTKLATEIKEEPTVDLVEAMADVDKILNEEDPEFLKEIEQIQIDAAIVSLSIMDDAISKMDKDSGFLGVVKGHLKNAVNIKANPKKVLLLWLLIAVAFAVVYFAPTILNRLFADKHFLKSYAELNSDVQSYNPLTESEPLFDNPKFAKNVVTMSKMKANIKKSEDSSPNPMLALELNIEGTTAEVTIEIKDREAEFKDILLRQAEDFTYSQLDSTDGKRELLNSFRTEMNKSLTQGQVRRVLLRSFILKP
ncbi:MAG: flagellar basal body-associated FliL family protein [Bdellovibrio sp.]|nr:flagellar basal body-associated FliL family protein [Bdellovibrio sp.]